MRQSVAAAFALLLACADSGELPEVGTTAGAVSVTWTNAVGVTASGNDLTKSSATAGWNAGASSVESLTGDGFVEFTAVENGTNRMVGLGSGDASVHYSDIEFAVHLRPNGFIGVYESGVLRGNELGRYQAGDRFRVEVSGAEVRYKRNGATFFTSLATPSFPLVVDTALNTPGTTVDDVELVSTGLDWQNAIGVAVDGRNLTKTIIGSWSAGASSVQVLAGDGTLEFTTGENTKGKMIGLSTDDASTDYADIDYAIYLKANGYFAVYESGVVRDGHLGDYVPGDIFRISVQGGVVTYAQNGGGPFYTSAVPAVAPLRVDVSLQTRGATVLAVHLREPAIECPAYDGGGAVCSGSFVVNSPEAQASAAACARITGNLTIDTSAMPIVSLPALERVDGDLTINVAASSDRVHVPELKEVGGRLRGGGQHVALSHVWTAGAIEMGSAGGLELRCLEQAGAFSADDLSIPRLRTVTGNVSGVVAAPALESVGGTLSGRVVASVLEAIGGDVTGDLTAPALVSIGGDIAETAEVTAPALVSVGGDVRGHPLDAPSLTDVSGALDYWDDTEVPALERASDLTIVGASSVDLPVLTEVTGLLRAGTPPCIIPGQPVATATSLTLPSLERAGGLHLCTHDPFSSASWALADVSLPLLRELGTPGPAATALFAGDSGVLSGIELPALESVLGYINVYFPLEVPALTEVRRRLTVRAPMTAPALLRVIGALDLHASLSADALQLIRGQLTINGPAVVSFPSLTNIAGIGASRSDELTVLELPALTRVEKTPTEAGSGGIELRRTQLSTLSMPSLVLIESDLTILGHASLADINFPALSALGPLLHIENNTALPTCQATDLEAQLRAAGWTGTATISGNDDGGTCP